MRLTANDTHHVECFGICLHKFSSVSALVAAITDNIFMDSSVRSYNIIAKVTMCKIECDKLRIEFSFWCRMELKELLPFPFLHDHNLDFKL